MNNLAVDRNANGDLLLATNEKLAQELDRFPHQQLEHPVEVKPGKARNLGKCLERERIVEMLDHMVDHSVHTLDIVEGGLIGIVAEGSQDMLKPRGRATVLAQRISLTHESNSQSTRSTKPIPPHWPGDLRQWTLVTSQSASPSKTSAHPACSTRSSDSP